MRYCVNCIHYTPAPTPTRGPMCMRFKREFVTHEDPVFGPKTNFSAPDCQAARGDGGQCGLIGRFYEPKAGSPDWFEAQHRKVEAELAAARARKEKQPGVRLSDVLRSPLGSDAAETSRRPWWKFW